METKLEQIAVKAVNQLPKSVVREIRTPRSVGAGGGRPPPATRRADREPDHVTRLTRPFLEIGLNVHLKRLPLQSRFGNRREVSEPRLILDRSTMLGEGLTWI